MASAVIVDKGNKTRKIEAVDYPRFSIRSSKQTVLINDVLPFRVRMTNIMVPGYNANNVPGIGIQVIGFSNYIL